MRELLKTGSTGIVKPAIRTFVAAATLSIALTVGTGGIAAARPAACPGTNFEWWRDDSLPLAEPTPAYASTADALVAIRSNFGLSVADVARVMGVSRQTLYDWFAERQTPQTQNAQRIIALKALSAQWRIDIGANLDSVQRRFMDKESLIAVLSSPDLASSATVAELRAIALARGNREKAPGIMDLIKDHGFAPLSDARQARAIEDALR